MLAKLLEHVIEKADSGAGIQRLGGVQVDADANAGFTCLAFDLRSSGQQVLHDLRPGFGRIAVPPHTNAAHAQIARELEVRVAITDHDARGDIDAALLDPGIDHRGTGLTTGASIGAQMWTDEHGIELDALTAECIEYELVRGVEAGLRKTGRTETVLIRDHGEAIAGPRKLPHCRKHARHEADFGQ